MLSLYEDFLCPALRRTSSSSSDPTDQQAHRHRRGRRRLLHGRHPGLAAGRRTTRRAPAAAAYCVADESIDAFRRFHAALYAAAARRERGATIPDNARLIEVARQAGAGGDVPDCINKGTYVEMVQGLAEATEHQVHPDHHASTARTTSTRTPDALVAKIKEIVGDVPGLMTAPPHPAPAPPVTVTAHRRQPAEPATGGRAAGVAVRTRQRGVGADRRVLSGWPRR